MVAITWAFRQSPGLRSPTFQPQNGAAVLQVGDHNHADHARYQQRPLIAMLLIMRPRPVWSRSDTAAGLDAPGRRWRPAVQRSVVTQKGRVYQEIFLTKPSDDIGKVNDLRLRDRR